MATSIHIIDYQYFIKLFFNCWIFFTIPVLSINAQVNDTSISVRNNDFFKRIINSKE